MLNIRPLIMLIFIMHIVLAVAQDANYTSNIQMVDRTILNSAQKAAHKAIANNDLRFLSVPICADLVPGYPVEQTENEVFPKPWGKSVRPLGKRCKEILDKELYEILQKNQSYAEEYNKIITEYLKEKLK